MEEERGKGKRLTDACQQAVSSYSHLISVWSAQINPSWMGRERKEIQDWILYNSMLARENSSAQLAPVFSHQSVSISVQYHHAASLSCFGGQRKAREWRKEGNGKEAN